MFSKVEWLFRGGGGGGVNGPLRQYFSLYWTVSQNEGERNRDMIDERN